MAILTRNEFAELCRIDIKKLNVYVSRGKVLTFVDPDDGLSKVDTDILQNQQFKEKQLDQFNKKLEQRMKQDPVEEVVLSASDESKGGKVINIVVPEKKTSEAKKKIIEKQNEIAMESSNWDKRKKQADALKAERSAELAQLQIDKMKGKLLPVELIQSVLVINIQTIFKEFESECLNLASIYTDVLAGGDRGKLAEITEKVREKINDVVKRSEETATNEIENAVDDYVKALNKI